MAQCSRCGKTGGMFDVKLYNLPNKQDKILCNVCYQEIIRSGEFYSYPGQQHQINCPGCNKPVKADFKICPYCKEKIAGRAQAPHARQGMHCESCGGGISPEYKICPFCGKKVEGRAKNVEGSSYCSKCGEKVISGEKFCSNCGDKVG